VSFENNDELQQAWEFAEHTGISIFLTGKAGTGKTTFLHQLRASTSKRLAVVAPTGVAAINAHGQTIHSFFQLPLSPYVPDVKFKDKYEYSREKRNILRTLDLLVIDEVSMVRADLLDAIDNVLRRFRDPRRPFGGVQLLMIGDLQQLAPVVTDQEAAIVRQYYDTPFFFSSKALARINYVTICLKHVFRQSDERFLALLNAIREGRADANVYRALNERYLPHFKPRPDEGYIRLTTHNSLAQRHNESELAKLETPPFTFQAAIDGNFPEYAYPTDVSLTLKEGAQVMFVRNDTSPDHRYYNGKIGRVTDIDEGRILVRCNGDDDDIEVEPATWENTKYALNEQTKELEELVQGTFTQYPLRLAWSITIHKSQGLTFDRAIIDAGQSFASGQVYVALSRCRTLHGLVLAGPISERAVIQDQRVTDYIARQESAATQSIAMLPQLKEQYIVHELCDLFDFSELLRKQERLSRVIDEHFFAQYADLSRSHQAALAGTRDMLAVAAKWQQVIAHTSTEGLASQEFADRVKRSAAYFRNTLATLFDDLLDDTDVDTDNKAHRKQFDEALYDLRLLLAVCNQTLDHVAQQGFSVADYHRCRNRATLDAIDLLADSKKAKKPTKRKADTARMLYPELYRLLVAWREKEAFARQVNPAIVMQQRALVNLVNLLPGDEASLVAVPFIGKPTAKRYANALLPIIRRFCERHHLQPATTAAVKQQAKQAKPAGNSRKISLDLYRQGKTIHEIAAERGYTDETVFGHLAHFVLRHELPLEALVPPRLQGPIADAIRRTGRAAGIRAIKEACPPEATYPQIRLMITMEQ